MTPTGELQVDYSATGVNDETGAAHTVDTMMYSCYPAEQQVYMLPVTSPDGFAGQTCAFVQLAAPTLAWVFDWTIMREGSQPAIPDPTPQDTDWVLLCATPEPMMQTVQIDGNTPVYRMSGTYVYGRRTAPANPYTAVCYPRPPWVANVFPRNVQTTLLEKGLSDTTAGGTGGGTVSPGYPNVPTGGPVRG